MLNNERGVASKNPLKKRGTPSEKSIGGEVSQNEIFKEFESTLGVTAKKAADIPYTNYSRNKAWKGGRRNATGPTLKLIKVLMAIKDTGIGKKFGV